MNPNPRKSGVSGASLLLTLTVVAGIVILFVIIARVVMVERRVSRGYSEIFRAEAAAQAATDDAGNLLLDLFTKYPDSATYWDPKIADVTVSGTTLSTGGTTPAFPGTVFMFKDKVPNELTYNSAGMANNVQIWTRPLVSGAQTKLFYSTTGTNDFTKTLPDDVRQDITKSIDINESSHFGDDPAGWVGTPPNATTTPPIRVPWVEVLKDPDQPKSSTNPVVARYAWWADDESFKLNINTAKAVPRGGPQASTETVAVGGKIEGDPKPTLQGVIYSGTSPDSDSSASIEEARKKVSATGGRFLSPLQIGHAENRPDDQTAEEFARKYKFLLTTESTGLNLSRTGARRLNLNALVDRSLSGLGTDGTPQAGPDLSTSTAKERVQKAVYQIIAGIENQAPNFGQRFYRRQTSNVLVPTTTSGAATAANKNKLDVSAAGATPHTSIYLQKVAADIYDQISPAANPTIINFAGQVELGNAIYSLAALGFDLSANDAESDPPEEENPLHAIGKKNLPFLTEYFWSLTVLNFADPSWQEAYGGIFDYEFEVDHYFEFWNMSDKAITPFNGDMGPHPYLVLENQPWIASKNKDIVQAPASGDYQDIGRGRPFEIKLDDDFLLSGTSTKISFRPNELTIITTDRNYASKVDLTGKTVYVATALYKPGTIIRNDGWDGTGFNIVSQSPYPNPLMAPVEVPNVRHFKVTSFDDRKDAGDRGEYQYGPDMIGVPSVKLILGNAYGLLDAHPSLTLQRLMPHNMLNLPNAGTTFAGSHLLGFSNRFGSFDPRGNLDAITIKTETKNASEGDFSSFAWTGTGNSLGEIQSRNSFFWDTDIVDFAGSGTVTIDRAASGPITIATGKHMLSIGDLGQVYDPIRNSSLDLDKIKTWRGGGRTLTIGQPDATWDGTRTSTITAPELQFQLSRSREWAAWRLADIFTVKRDSVLSGDAKAEEAGLYNPNGILRDGGRVLRAFLEGIQFSSDSDPSLAGSSFSTSNTDQILSESQRTSMTASLAGNGGRALANYLAQRLTRSIPGKFSPIWEPGELSQLPFFSPKVGTSNVAYIKTGLNNDKINDRGREEIFRRIVDLVTPKGNTFTIYVVGQSLDSKGKPTATKAQRVTVRLHPVFNPQVDPQVDDGFDPSIGTEISNRFRRPSAYKLEVLSTEDA